MNNHLLRSTIKEAVDLERYYQDQKWGIQNHEDQKWLTILTEEIGEVAKAILEQKPNEVKEELVQVTAVCVAWLEAIERRNATNS